MITLENTTKSFNGKRALEGLSLNVPKGEVYGLLGPNGAGKSTTLNVLLGFLAPDIGSASIKGLDTFKQNDKVRSITGYIPENVSLYPYLSGMENLKYFCNLAGIRYTDSELEDILSICGLQEEAYRSKTKDYSKGMRQKVGIAIAYAKQAEVYLLDEPASGLDPYASNELSFLLQSIAAEGRSVLMVSHDIFRVKETCHRIGILKKGRLVEEVFASKVSANELEKIYLSHMLD